MKFKSFLLFVVATAPILSDTPTHEAAMNAVDPMNQAAQAIAGLAIQLKAQVPAYEKLDCCNRYSTQNSALQQQIPYARKTRNCLENLSARDPR